MKTKQTLIAFILLASYAEAHAGILADMNGMFMSNSTAPGTLSTRDRSGVFGGSFSMRTPVQSVNLVSFDKPRMSAGCGGVDLYGGSFTFINGQQLIQIFRNVASNAAGLAFKAAIKSISPSLDQLITEFQTLMQDMNNLAKNSCSLAHMIVDPAEKAINNAIDGQGNSDAVQKGFFSDSIGSLTGYLAQADSYFKDTASVSPSSGNMLAKAAVASGATSIMGMAGLPNVDGSTDNPTNPNSLNNKVLYALLGYSISGVACDSQNQAGTPTSSTDQSNNAMPRIECSAPASITLHDFVVGGGAGSSRPSNPLQLYECVDPAGTSIAGGFEPQICSKMKTIDFPYEGIIGWVNNMLFGTPDASATNANSIVGEFNSGASAVITAPQQAFLRQSGIPLLALMSKTSDPLHREQIAHKLKQRVVDCVTAEFGQALYKGATAIQTNNSYKLTDAQLKNIDSLRSDVSLAIHDCSNDDSVLKVITALNEAATLKAGSNN